jgi:hypothetical protein
MRRLGYGRYGAQGGDWGHAVARELGVIDAGRVVGVHLNTLLTPAPEDPAEEAILTDDDRARLDRLVRAQAEMAAYVAVQSTRPQTPAYALTDSPVGQLAWIVEKFKEWTDGADVPEDAVDRDRLLTNVMLYWLTRTAGSSARLYYDTAHPAAASVAGPQPRRSTTPTGVAVFARDIAAPVRRLAERDNTIVHRSELPRAGTSPRWRNRTCSSATSARSSAHRARCGQRSQTPARTGERKRCERRTGCRDRRMRHAYGSIWRRRTRTTSRRRSRRWTRAVPSSTNRSG